MAECEWKPRPDVGQRLVPDVIDDLARDEPHRVLFEQPLGKLADVFQKTTCKEFANAINRTAWWLEKALGRKSATFETIGYIGPGDLRYLVLVVAAIKAGYKMLFMSPRNSLEGHLAVLKATDCKLWLQPSTGGDIEEISKAYHMRTLPFPDLGEILDPAPAEHYSYTRGWESGQNDPGWVLHTSGSTGLPKPIVRTLASASITESHRLCEPVNGRPLLINDMIGKRVYVTLPLFHSLGMAFALHWPIFYDQTVVLGPLVPLTAAVVNDVLEEAKPDVLLSSPTVLEELSENEDSLERIAQLKAVANGGGPLAPKAGDAIAAKTHLIVILGSTESGWITSLEKDREDWAYLHFHPNAGLELRPHTPGLYELFVVRDQKLAPWQTVFSNFPHLQEYSFKDLFSKHPTKLDLWHHEGRADNIIVLSNGEKFNPLAMELSVAEHRLVRSILVTGYGRFQTSAIIELSDEAPRLTKSDKEIIDGIWPKIEAANKTIDSHGRLQKEFIILASPEKPFLRAGKGTVQKALTLELYSQEIGALYDVANSQHEADLVQIDTSDFANLKNGILSLARNVSGSSELGENDDLFVTGSFDSLQVLTLLRKLKSSFRAPFLDITRESSTVLKSALIYTNPTVEALSTAIYRLLSSEASETEDEVDGTQDMQELFRKYAARLPGDTRTSKMSSSADGDVVLLTGSTGSLGSYILDALIRSPDVKEIWCLNRSADAEKRQTKSSLDRGLAKDWKSANVTFFHADLSIPNFGVDKDAFEYLLQNVTRAIHNSWRVDFNLSLSSFEPHVAGVFHLAEFASLASHNVSMLFISSVGTFQNWKSTMAVPESPLVDFSVASRGYGRSKLVAETLLVEATKRGLLDAKICRLGQIAGPVGGVNGEWNRHEWIPTMIAASAEMGILPSTLGRLTLDWIPVDLMAQIVVELALPATQTPKEPSIYHATNPRESNWSNLVPAIQKHLPSLGLVSLKDWVSAHRKAVENAGDTVIPGAKLLEFFQGLSNNSSGEKLEVDTSRTSLASQTFRELKPVSHEWMDLWMSQWGY